MTENLVITAKQHWGSIINHAGIEDTVTRELQSCSTLSEMQTFIVDDLRKRVYGFIK